jgi:hypothetical protein
LQHSASSQSDDRNGFANTLHFESGFIHSVFTNLYARQYTEKIMLQDEFVSAEYWLFGLLNADSSRKLGQ